MVGLNARITVWRIHNATDDPIGGAVLTGTPVYQNVRARLENDQPTQALLEQGFETPRLVTVIIPGSFIVLERDEVEVTSPVTHAYFGKRLRVLGVQMDSLHPRDPRNHTELKVRRVETSRREL